MRIRPDGAELFHAERRTEGHDEVNVVAFHNIMSALENFSHFCIKTLALRHRLFQKRQSNFVTVLPPFLLYAVDQQASILAFTNRKHTSK
jgi:hypothetical protein